MAATTIGNGDVDNFFTDPFNVLGDLVDDWSPFCSSSSLESFDETSVAKDDESSVGSGSNRTISPAFSDTPNSASTSISSLERLFNRGQRTRYFSLPTLESNLSRDAPEFVPSSYASVAANGIRDTKMAGKADSSAIKLPQPNQMFRKPPPPPPNSIPFSTLTEEDKSKMAASSLTMNNQPRLPVRMRPLKRNSLPHVSLQTSYTVSVPSTNNNSRRRSSFPQYCVHCKSIGENSNQYQSHSLENPLNKKVICPILRNYECEKCGSTGDEAHTENQCPLNLINKTSSTCEYMIEPKYSFKGQTR